jgi:hypothetical protein
MSDSVMMGRQTGDQSQLFYLFNLEKCIPPRQCQTPRTPAGEIVSPRCLSSLATRIWPNAGRSKASATTASSISCCTRFATIGFLREIATPARRLCHNVP